MNALEVVILALLTKSAPTGSANQAHVLEVFDLASATITSARNIEDSIDWELAAEKMNELREHYLAAAHLAAVGQGNETDKVTIQ
ncbi:hypothetical protein [Microbaculum marinisediminis]|uniref:Uncharacterized protein n=1 Tax=Microbaculum marinisediminis TaxID=2931392 RepID=A0AAW5QWW5_9HYPH|nr:hypothetical protein [Microbaculum sp. A6E488]MCT8970888.1 hypothetical protein [Microbaculum sp. A6E488]